MSRESILAKVFSDRRRDPDGKREAILRTAVQLFLDDGYARTAMNQIADRLKITKPALYHYFRNKEEILAECYRWGCLLIRDSLDEITQGGGSGLEQVAAFIRSYVTVISVDFGKAVIRLDDAELSGSTGSEVRSYKREIDRRLRLFIQAGIEDGSIVPCDPKLAAFAIAGALNWICTWYRPSGAMSAEEVAENYVTILTKGLSSGGTQVSVIQSAPTKLKVINERAGKNSK